MDVNALSLLVDIVDAGNLSRAAAKLGMTRANVSKRLNQFERSLGAELLKRSTRHLEPTELGRQLYAHGKNIRHEVMAAQESLENQGCGLRGTVRFSVPSGYGQHAMAPWFIEFMELYPGITLDVIFDNDIEDLMQGAVNFAVRVMNEVPNHLVSQHCGVVDYVACAAPQWVQQHGDVHTLSALKHRPLITSGMTAEKLRFAAQTEADKRHIHVQPRLMSANFFFLRDAILQGMGAGLVPQYMVDAEIASGQLVRLSLPLQDLAFLRADIYLLFVPARYQTQAQILLMEFLRDKVSQGFSSRLTQD
ncbi:LysR family transcriptional regulator [Comamonas sp. NoAH]|uniref:LysR family transcriptional regulator n=1 Tax=Comamonas halotolerans TaxID=3041496 RepID=UPI0024E0BE37|nr:LysR family transcriptional regulator [Comamonas sp. NoAH]